MDEMSGHATSASRDDYIRVRNEIYDCLVPRLLRRRENAPDTRFAPKGLPREVLHDDRLRRFYQTLCPDHLDNQSSIGVGESEFVKRVLDRELQPHIAILVFIGADVAASMEFATTVVAKPADSRDSLPLSVVRLDEIFTEPVIKELFTNNQHRFCTLTLFQDPGPMVLTEGEHAQLPYMNERNIGEGGFGMVFEVEIPHGHLILRPNGERSIPEGNKVVARKDYIGRRHIEIIRRDFEMERDTCQVIRGSPVQCENVLLIYGTIDCGSSFSLLMPKAEYDLRQYMKTHGGDTTRSVKDIARHLKCAAGLARGLEHLHHGLELEDGARLVCSHMDLKPANILIFHEGEGNDRMVWKISDFGLSRVKIRGNSADRLTVSPTVNRGGDGCYLAPESELHREMTSKSDVWSFACIASELCVWLLNGSDGFEEYYTRRQKSHGDNIGKFHTKAHFNIVHVNPGIDFWHKKIIKGTKDRIVEEILRDVLKYLEGNAFQIDPRKRSSASKLQECLSNAAAKGFESATTPINGSTMSRHRISQALRSTIKWQSGHQRNISSVKSWPVSAPRQLQGCQFSSDGYLLTYYSSEPNYIALYYGSSQFPPSGQPFPRLGEHMHSSEIASIGITRHYMVVAERADNFRFTLFSFIESRSNEPYFNHKTLVRTDRAPSIHLIAISPRGGWIACIVKGTRDKSIPGRLYLAKRRDVLTSRETNDSGFGDGVWKHTDLPVSMNQDATNVSSLTFSSESAIWFICEPTLEFKTACLVRLGFADRQTLPPFELAKFELPQRVLCYAPFHNSNKCVIVTNQNILVVHDFDNPYSRGVTRNIKKSLEIINIIMSRDDCRTLALAKKAHEFGKLHLVELHLEGDNSMIQITIIEHISVQYQLHRLHKVQLIWVEPEPRPGGEDPQNQPDRVLIALLAKSNENAIFEVNIRTIYSAEGVKDR